MSICFQAELALQRLRELDKEPQPGAVTRTLLSNDGRTRMRLEDITTEESLFQPRSGINEDHVETLRKAKRSLGDLDPILIIQVGPKTILLDGHHRLETYRRSKATTIPVEFYRGSLEEAIDEAGQENTKARLPMTNEERHDYAWRRTVLGIGSIAVVAKVSGVSQRTVTTMRQVRDRINAGLGSLSNAKAGYYGTWKEARRAARGEQESPFMDYEDHMQQKAQDIATKMYKQFGTAFTASPVLTAKVLEIMFGDKLTEVQRELREILDGDSDEEDEEDLEEASGTTF